MIPSFLALTLLASVYPNRLYEYIGLAATMLALCVQGRRCLRWKPVNLGLLMALAATGLVGTWWSGASVTDLGIEWFVAALWYWTMSNGLRVPRGRRAVGIGVGLAAAAYALWAAWDYARGDYRVAGPTPHANILALLANIWFPLLLLWGLHAVDRRRWMGLAAVASGLALVGVVLVTLSRTGIAVAVLNLGLVAGLRWRMTSRLALMATAMAVVAMLFVTGHAIVRRNTQAPPSNLRARWRYDKVAWAMLRDHPLGVGTGRFPEVSDGPPYNAMRWPYPRNIVHSAPGQIAAECGWLGLGVALLLYGRLVSFAWRGAGLGPQSTGRSGPAQVVQQGALLGYLALFITGTMESVMWMEPCNLAWITLAAISLATPAAGEPAP